MKPNDLGLFDIQGNVYAWCQERYKDYPNPKDGNITDDLEDALPIVSTTSRVLRGGSFGGQASYVRSAQRVSNVPATRDGSYGFRPSRTLPLVPFTALPPTPEGGRR